MKIRPNDPKLIYSGRIDWRREQEPVFVFPCTFVNIKFSGNVLKIRIRNKRAYWDNYIGCLIDGEQIVVKLAEIDEEELNLPIRKTELEFHEVWLFKRQDSCHEFSIVEFEIEDGAKLMEAEPLPKRKIEVYGDSVSAGEVSEAMKYIGREDPKHNGQYSNGWYSYAWILARKLNAQLHDIAQGGVALIDRTGWFHWPDTIGMESIWDKVRYHPLLTEMVPWDFSLYTPEVVIVAIGQNDNHPRDYMSEDYEGMDAVKWRDSYADFLRKIRYQYPNTHMICCTTLLWHDSSWDRAIGQAIDQLGDCWITQYIFKRNGKGTKGHLRIPEAIEMAEELSSYIETLEIEGWNQDESDQLM